MARLPRGARGTRESARIVDPPWTLSVLDVVGAFFALQWLLVAVVATPNRVVDVLVPSLVLAPLFVLQRVAQPCVVVVYAVVATLLLALTGLFLTGVFFNETHPGSPHFLSPCGVSGCTQATFVDSPYNPNGFWSGVFDVDEATTTMCVYDACAFAVSNGRPISGRGGCLDTSPGHPCYATTNPSDYPNPGTGNAGGVEPGYDVSLVDATACPGTGVGGCPTCLAYWVLVLNNTVPATLTHCVIPTSRAHMTAAQNNTLWCGGACRFARTPGDTEAYARDFFVLFQFPWTMGLTRRTWANPRAKYAAAGAVQLAVNVAVVAVSQARLRVTTNPVAFTPMVFSAP